MVLDDEILKKAHAYALRQFSQIATPKVATHTLQHTQLLVARTEEVGRANDLQEEELKLALLAAWLHDLSYVFPQEPEQGIVADFFQVTGHSNGTTAPQTDKIARCIAASHFPQHPEDTLEEVFCDAVASFTATPDYVLQAAEALDGKPGKCSPEAFEWIKQQRTLLKKHSFFTRYAKRNFSADKDDAIKLLKKKCLDFSEDNEELQKLWQENKRLQRQLNKEREQKVSKGIETMFRTTITNHIQLSVMADSKANLMISINAIIASIMISSFVRQFDEVPHLIAPSILLTIVCVLTIVFAVLSTRPNIRTKIAPSTKLDYLFFGDFVHLSSDTYKNELRGIMHNPDRLYDSMIENIFMQGKVLAKKYKLLKIAYTIFMAGFGIVLLSYAIAWLFFAPV